MQEHVQSSSSQPQTKEPTGFSNNDALYFRAASERLDSVEVGHERVEASKNALSKRALELQLPKKHEVISKNSTLVIGIRWDRVQEYQAPKGNSDDYELINEN